MSSPDRIKLNCMWFFLQLIANVNMISLRYIYFFWFKNILKKDNKCPSMLPPQKSSTFNSLNWELFRMHTNLILSNHNRALKIISIEMWWWNNSVFISPVQMYNKQPSNQPTIAVVQHFCISFECFIYFHKLLFRYYHWNAFPSVRACICMFMHARRPKFCEKHILLWLFLYVCMCMHFFQ